MTLDEPTRALLDVALAPDQPRLHQLSPSEARTLLRERALARPRAPEVAETWNTSIEGVPVRWFRPHESPRVVVCFLHAGGWMLGGPDDAEVAARTLCAEARALVCVVDYRLAPEDPFPAGLDDAWAVLRVLPDEADRLVDNALPLVLLGESAGGNLAAVLAQRAADAGPTVARQVLLYPVVDCDLDRPSYLDEHNQLLLDRVTMAWFWDSYRSPSHDRTIPDLSPLRAARLSGLPPALVVVAEHDVLRDEGEAYARRLAEAGCDVRLELARGQMHGFMSLPDRLPVGAAYWRVVAEELRDGTPGRVGAPQAEPTIEGAR